MARPMPREEPVTIAVLLRGTVRYANREIESNAMKQSVWRNVIRLYLPHIVYWLVERTNQSNLSQIKESVNRI